jgi:hypothetical protein
MTSRPDNSVSISPPTRYDIGFSLYIQTQNLGMFWGGTVTPQKSEKVIRIKGVNNAAMYDDGVNAAMV